MRGQFVRGDGLILPNNISLAGAEAILAAAMQGASQSWYIALVAGPPTLDMTSADMTEPTIGTNGYARQELTQDATGWPTIDNDGNAAYVESATVTFPATGAYDQGIQRVALIGTATYTAEDDIIALSAPMDEEVVIDASTPLAERQFRYQLFL